MMRTRIQGIPCQVDVLSYAPYEPGSWHEPASGGEMEFNVYDRRGYRAAWLERKVTEDDEARIFGEYEAELQGMRDEARIDAYITRMSA